MKLLGTALLPSDSLNILDMIKLSEIEGTLPLNNVVNNHVLFASSQALVAS